MFLMIFDRYPNRYPVLGTETQSIIKSSNFHGFLGCDATSECNSRSPWVKMPWRWFIEKCRPFGTMR